MERLEIYKQALRDWSVDTFMNHNCWIDDTYLGLCTYFYKKGLFPPGSDFKTVFPELYLFRKRDGVFLWNGQGSDGQYLDGGEFNGREERIEALKKAISYIEKLKAETNESSSTK